MAFKKGYKKRNYKKRTYKKKATTEDMWAKGGATVGRVAYKAYNLARRIKDAVNIEYKDFEQIIAFNELGDGSNNPNVSDSIFAHPLCLPTQGLGQSNRIGDSIKLQRLTGRGHIAWLNQAAPTTGTVTANVRVILFRGKAEAGRPYPSTVTVGSDKPMLDQKGVIGAKSDENKYNTKFLYDRTYRLDIARTNLITLKWNFPLNWHQNFEVGSTDIADGGVYMMVVADTGVVSKCELIMNYCVTFTDD